MHLLCTFCAPSVHLLRQVLEYLRAFADYYKIHDLVQLNTAVERVTPLTIAPQSSGQGTNMRFRVQTRRMENRGGKTVPVPDQPLEQVSKEGEFLDTISQNLNWPHYY